MPHLSGNRWIRPDRPSRAKRYWARDHMTARPFAWWGIVASLSVLALLVIATRGRAAPLRTQMIALIATLAAPESHIAPALEQALQRLTKLEPGQDLKLFDPIRQAVLRAAVDAQVRMDIEARLLRLLPGDGTDLAKQYACRQLASVGSDDSVAVVAALLPNPRLSHMARYALEGIGGPVAIRALREALATARGRQRIGLVISLGRRGDTDGVVPIAALLDEDDAQLCDAAIVALGRIGTLPAADALRDFAGRAWPAGSRGKRSTPAATAQPRRDAHNDVLRHARRGLVFDAELSVAESLCRQGQYRAAAQIYTALQSAEAPRVRAAAFRGLIAARPAESVAMILAGLAVDTEPWKRAVAADCVVALKDPQAIRTIAEAAERLPLAGKIAAFVALRNRTDPAVRAAALKALEQSSSAVQVASLETLIAAATADDVPALIDLAATAKDPQVRDATRKTLRLMTASGTNQAILSVLGSGKDPTGLVLRCALARRWPGAVPAFLKAAESPHAAVRLEALKALEVMATPEDAPRLVALLGKTKPGPERSAADRAVWVNCQRISDPAHRRAPLLTALTKADATARSALLPTLGRCGGAAALTAVHAAMRDSNQAVRDAGYRALANWPDASVADELLKIATTSAVPAYRIWSLRAYVRVVSLPNQRPPQQTFEMLRSAMRLATRTQDRALVVTRLGTVRVPAALTLLLTFVDDAPLSHAAVTATFTLAKGLSQSHPDQAEAALKRIRTLTDNPAILQQIPKVLRDIDARKQGQKQ